MPVVKCYIQVLQMLLVQLPHPGKQLSLQIFIQITPIDLNYKNSPNISL